MSPIPCPDGGLTWPNDSRGRLVASMAIVASERGYAATRVRDVLARTGISSRTFYAYFPNRQACFFAAYDAIVCDVATLIGYAGELPPDTAVEFVLNGLLEHFAVRPAHARVLLVEVLSAGPSGGERHEQTMAMLADRLAACECWRPEPCATLDRHDIAQAVIGAILRMVQLRLSTGDAAALPRLLPSLTAMTTRVRLAA